MGSLQFKGLADPVRQHKCGCYVEHLASLQTIRKCSRTRRGGTGSRRWPRSRRGCRRWCTPPGCVCVLVGEVFQGNASRLLALDPLQVRPVHLVQLFLVLAAVLRMHLHPKHQGGKGKEEVLHGDFSWVSQDTARPPAVVSAGPCQMDTSCASRLGPIISP